VYITAIGNHLRWLILRTDVILRVRLVSRLVKPGLFAVKMPILLMKTALYQAKFACSWQADSHVAVQSVRFRAH
jgi:hypothetical protein